MLSNRFLKSSATTSAIYPLSPVNQPLQTVMALLDPHDQPSSTSHMLSATRLSTDHHRPCVFLSSRSTQVYDSRQSSFTLPASGYSQTKTGHRPVRSRPSCVHTKYKGFGSIDFTKASSTMLRNPPLVTAESLDDTQLLCHVHFRQTKHFALAYLAENASIPTFLTHIASAELGFDCSFARELDLNLLAS